MPESFVPLLDFCSLSATLPTKVNIVYRGDRVKGISGIPENYFTELQPAVAFARENSCPAACFLFSDRLEKSTMANLTPGELLDSFSEPATISDAQAERIRNIRRSAFVLARLIADAVPSTPAAKDYKTAAMKSIRTGMLLAIEAVKVEATTQRGRAKD